MSREYVSTEYNCRRISVIVHRSVSDKLAVDSLVLHACLWTQSQREREVVDHLPQIPGNSCWDVNSKRFFWFVRHWKIPGTNGNCEKVVPFGTFRMEIS